METTKTFQFRITYLENGAVKTEQYDKEFTPFELLGIITHIKNEIEIDLLLLSKRKNEKTKKRKNETTKKLNNEKTKQRKN